MAAIYAKVSRRAILDHELTDGALRVLNLLGLHAWGDKSIVKGKAEAFIAELGISRSAFFEAIAQAEKLGLLERRSRRGELYQLIFDSQRATDDSPPSRTLAARQESAQPDSKSPPNRTVESAQPDCVVRPAGLTSPPSRTPRPLNNSFNSSFNREAEAQPSSSESFADVFDEPAHRAAYLAYRGEHRMPDGFDATVRSVHDPATGCARFDWPTIGAALLDMRGAAARFTPNALRAFCRRLIRPNSSNGEHLTRQERGREALTRTLIRHGFSNGHPADDQPIPRALPRDLPDHRTDRPDGGGVDDRA